MQRKRCVIYPQDIQRMTSKSERYSQNLLQKVRMYFKKEPHQFVTIREFSQFSGIPLEDIDPYIEKS
ncbi:MAG: hypothetical protein ACXIUD_07345 [Mongoliitalea sp.]